MPEADKNGNGRENKPNWVDIATLVVLTFTLVAVVCYTRTTQRILEANERQFAEIQRPWLAIEEDSMTFPAHPQFTVGFPDQNPRAAMKVTFSLRLKNFGKSPALNAGMGDSIFIPRRTDPSDQALDMPDKTDKPMTDACASAEAGNSFADTRLKLAQIVFPEGTAPDSDHPIGAIPNGTNYVSGTWLLICVAYQDQSVTGFHHSRFWYHSPSGQNATTIGGDSDIKWVPFDSMWLWHTDVD